MFFGLKLFVLYEKGTGFLSPKASLVFFQSIEWLLALGGVPVFKRPHLKPILVNTSVRPDEGPSPILPASTFRSPMWITPDRKVPQVTITAGASIFSPYRNIAQLITLLFIIRSTTSPSITLIGLVLIFSLTSNSYDLLSTCALGDQTDIPFVLFNTLN